MAYTHFPEPLDGPEAFKEMLAQTHRYFPDLNIEVDAVVADGNQVVVHWRYRGTFQNGEMPKWRDVRGVCERTIR